MATRKLTDTEIQMRVCAKRLRWPEAGTTIAWTELHNCVDSLHRLVRTVDNSCAEVERNIELSTDGIARRRKELGDQALSKLAAFKPLQTAERAVDENINDLEPKMQNLLRKALEELREGIAATERAVVERCRMRADPSVAVVRSQRV